MRPRQKRRHAPQLAVSSRPPHRRLPAYPEPLAGQGMTVAVPPEQVLFEIRLAEYSDTYCNRKLVFENLEDVLQKKGYRVAPAETRERGRGTVLALRIKTKSQAGKKLAISTNLSVVKNSDEYFTYRIIFRNLEENLEAEGILIKLCSTRESRRET